MAANDDKSCLPFLLICSVIIPSISAANDTIDTSQSIRDGETLVSSGGIFELGFFSPGNSPNRYLGIWYRNTSAHTVVWVANRQAPLTKTSGVLRVAESGILALLDDTNGSRIWSSNATSGSVGAPTARLLDTGNLVVKDANNDSTENFLWQSFDYPSESFLVGMRPGWNYATGVETYFTSWRSKDDPALGDFTFHIDPTGYPQIVIKRLSAIKYRSGPWNGARFGGAPGTRNVPKLRMNKIEVRYEEDTVDDHSLTMLRLNPDGVAQRWDWNYQSNSWTVQSNVPADECDTYGFCGANSVCRIENSPPCGCLDGFFTRDRGCVRRTPLNCTGDVFLKYSGIKFPDSRYSWFDDRTMRLADCEAECFRNCSCVAYAQLDIRQDISGCLFYRGDLIDTRIVAQGGQDLFIRQSLFENGADSKGKKRVVLVASITSVAAMVLLVFLVFVVVRCRKRKKDQNLRSHGQEADLPFFDFSTIMKATDDFAVSNKLGEGGFGPVYRGTLEDGQEIAVKRLSKTSAQGVEELKNEVILIAKLQHRNMVRLLGCCVDGKENMLIYEYMPNNSLDLILFDQTNNVLLDWQKRFNIINGIARGLLYLHQDSRLRIVHRDLKASNILLDADMNPKISDFGLARSFGGTETEAKTRKVVGTYGYMSPEYAIDGLFSVKSDVFSFGVLVLEVVSGKRNRGFSLNDSNLNLLEHAWTLYKQGKSCELVDASLGGSFDLSQVLRSIHVGLLCVQKRPEDRPSMSSVVFMLGNEVQLPRAKKPGFFTGRDVSAAPIASSKNKTTSSENQVAITLPEPR